MTECRGDKMARAVSAAQNRQALSGSLYGMWLVGKSRCNVGYITSRVRWDVNWCRMRSNVRRRSVLFVSMERNAIRAALWQLAPSGEPGAPAGRAPRPSSIAFLFSEVATLCVMEVDQPRRLATFFKTKGPETTV